MLSVYMSVPLLLYCCFLAALTGAVMGSFLHCAAWRIVHNEKIARGRSHCPNCGHVLAPSDLIPILSWVLLKGRCRYCKKSIPPRYVLAEIIMAVMTVLLLLRFDLTVEFVRNLLFTWCLFTLSVTDLEDMLIPDRFHVIAVAVWILALPMMGYSAGETVLHLCSGIAFALVIFLVSLVLSKVLQKDAMGGGDIKLFAVMGLYLGFLPGLFAVILACVMGIAAGGLLRKYRPSQQMETEDIPDMAFPFGPCIAAATWVMLLCGSNLADWYLSLL